MSDKSGLEKVKGGYISLLPESYIPLSTSNIVTLISVPFLAFGLLVYVVALILGGFLMVKFLFKKKR